MDLGLDGARVLVTGGTRGIGRAICEAFLAEGAAVAFCARREDEVGETQQTLTKTGGRAVGRVLDVADHAALAQWVGEMAEELGGIDVFIPNVSAGASAQGVEAWRANFEVDVLHSVLGCEAALSHLAASEQGAIVLVNTIAAVESLFAPHSYGALKAALISWGKQMAVALGPHGVRVNMVSPGPVHFPGGDWDRVRGQDPALYRSVEQRIPMGRFIRPEEVARAVVYLASPAAAMVTGTNLVIDGGMTRRVQF
ncbi:MAG: SDR family oxidoreductase [Alphaproteobacteria bacterium]|nr:MAG: SDR family oxidoreductase [Alphaproteobacteria bacterium]